MKNMTNSQIFENVTKENFKTTCYILFVSFLFERRRVYYK